MSKQKEFKVKKSARIKRVLYPTGMKAHWDGETLIIEKQELLSSGELRRMIVEKELLDPTDIYKSSSGKGIPIRNRDFESEFKHDPAKAFKELYGFDLPPGTKIENGHIQIPKRYGMDGRPMPLTWWQKVKDFFGK